MQTVDPERMIHPLRECLTQEDWQRLQDVIAGTISEHNATVEELDAVNDVLFDAVVAKLQTVPGTTVLQ